MTRRPSALSALKRKLVEAMLRSRLDCTDDLFTITKLFVNLRFEPDWSAQRLIAQWKELLAAPPPRHLFELYLHFPLCRFRCSYCFTNSRVSAGPAQIERCIEDAEKEARFFAPHFSGVNFEVFSVGGGTPSLMSPEQLRRFCGPVMSAFRLATGGPRSIELNPATTDAAKLRVIKELGFNRVSFGVQSMNPKVLKRVARLNQDHETVRAAVHAAQAVGFDGVNVDVIFGLVDEPLESFLDGVRQIAEIRPSEITVCTLSLTDRYMKAAGVTRAQYVEYFDKNVVPAFEGVMRIVPGMGYASSPLANPDSGEWWFVDAQKPVEDVRSQYNWESGPRTGSMLGLGPGSRSQIYERLVYERHGESFDARRPLFHAAVLSRKKDMITYILANLEHEGRLEFADFRRRYGKDIRDVLPLELKILKAARQIQLGAEGFRYLPRVVPNRVVWASVFALEALAELPLGRELLPRPFLRRLSAELSGVELRPRGG